LVGKRLRHLRLAKGLTQRELAEPRYTHAYLCSIETGRKPGSKAALEYFATKLGVSLEELTTGRSPHLETQLGLRMMEGRVALSAGKLDEAAEIFEGIIKQAHRYRLPRVQARAEELLGLRLERLGEPEEALSHYQRSEEILKDEPAVARAAVVQGKARCFHSLGDVRYGIHILESLLAEIRREGVPDPDGLARVHSELVFGYVEVGLYAQAAESATELEVLAPRVSDPERIGGMSVSAARLYLVHGDAERAQRLLQRAEDAYRQLDLATEVGLASLARGYVYAREGQLPEARVELRKALTSLETADQGNYPRVLCELARVERLEDNPDEARHLLEQAIALIGTADTPILAGAHRELGLVLTDIDPSTAEKHLRVAIDLFALAEQHVDVAVTYRALGDLLGARGESEASCEAYRTGIVALEDHR
jgi:tetratricopeptide (TPR) repeat protein